MSEFTGIVAKRAFATGSKSEHEAVILLTREAVYRLRRAEGPSFADPELQALVGRRIVCTGAVFQGVLMMQSWTIVDE